MRTRYHRDKTMLGVQVALAALRRYTGSTLPAGFVVVFGCVDVPERPIPPDMSALAVAYESPNGVADAATIGWSVKIIEERREQLDEIDSLRFVQGELTATQRSLGDFVQPTRNHENPVVEGAAALDARCPGWGEGERGTLHLAALFTDLGVKPVTWGRFLDCHRRIRERNVRLDGRINILIQGDRAFKGPSESGYLFDLNTTVGFQDEGAESPGRPFVFDFRLNIETQGVEVRVTPTPGEDLIYFESADRATRGIRASNGTFVCDFEARTCEDGSKVIRW